MPTHFFMSDRVTENKLPGFDSFENSIDWSTILSISSSVKKYLKNCSGVSNRQMLLGNVDSPLKDTWSVFVGNALRFQVISGFFCLVFFVDVELFCVLMLFLVVALEVSFCWSINIRGSIEASQKLLLEYSSQVLITFRISSSVKNELVSDMLFNCKM